MLQFPEDILLLYSGLKPAYKKVYTIIRATVLSGQLGSSQRLTEQAVAQALGVSRTPVRAALAKLKSEGILSSVSKTGTGIKQLSKTDKNNLLFMDELLEGAAAYLAATRASQESIDILTELNDAMKEFHLSNYRLMDVRGIRDLHLQFHLMVAKMSGNSFLYEDIVEIRNMMRMHHADRSVVMNTYPEQVTPLHDRLIEALRNCCAEDAKLWMRADIRNSKDVYIQSKIGDEDAI